MGGTAIESVFLIEGRQEERQFIKSEAEGARRARAHQMIGADLVRRMDARGCSWRGARPACSVQRFNYSIRPVCGNECRTASNSGVRQSFFY